MTEKEVIERKLFLKKQALEILQKEIYDLQKKLFSLDWQKRALRQET